MKIICIVCSSVIYVGEKYYALMNKPFFSFYNKTQKSRSALKTACHGIIWGIKCDSMY